MKHRYIYFIRIIFYSISCYFIPVNIQVAEVAVTNFLEVEFINPLSYYVMIKPPAFNWLRCSSHSKPIENAQTF